MGKNDSTKENKISSVGSSHPTTWQYATHQPVGHRPSKRDASQTNEARTCPWQHPNTPALLCSIPGTLLPAAINPAGFFFRLPIVTMQSESAPAQGPHAFSCQRIACGFCCIGFLETCCSRDEGQTGAYADTDDGHEVPLFRNTHSHDRNALCKQDIKSPLKQCRRGQGGISPRASDGHPQVPP